MQTSKNQTAKVKGPTRTPPTCGPDGKRFGEINRNCNGEMSSARREGNSWLGLRHLASVPFIRGNDQPSQEPRMDLQGHESQ
jgi:hypothetical protein